MVKNFKVVKVPIYKSFKIKTILLSPWNEMAHKGMLVDAAAYNVQQLLHVTL